VLSCCHDFRDLLAFAMGKSRHPPLACSMQSALVMLYKSTRFLVCIAFVALMAGCIGTQVQEQEQEQEQETAESCSEPPAMDDALVQSTFSFPSEGTPNNNGYIGPFCCTGQTVTIESIDGHVVGYAYFYSWKGQAYTNTATNHSWAPDMRILVAGLADATDPSSTMEEGEVAFDASEMEICASRSGKVGQLRFTVTITDVLRNTGQDYFDMESPEVRLDVAVEP